MKDIRQLLKALESSTDPGQRRMVGVTLTDKEIEGLDRYAKRHKYKSRMALIRALVLALIQEDRE